MWLHSRQELAQDSRNLGVEAGDTLFLHASIRAVGPIAGGPDQIHLALAGALTTAGTLMMYAGCPEYYDEVGHGHLTPEQESEILAKLPPFDALTGRSQRENGALVELLRTWPGARVSLHPARFVAMGRHAGSLLADPPWDYAFGHGSPLDRFLHRNGKILLLGSDHDNVTFLQYAEHVAPIAGRRVARFLVPVTERGAVAWKQMEEFDTSEAGAHPHWPERFFARLVDGFLASTTNRGAPVGDAHAYLFRTRDLLDFALPWRCSITADPANAARL